MTHPRFGAAIVLVFVLGCGGKSSDPEATSASDVTADATAGTDGAPEVASPTDAEEATTEAIDADATTPGDATFGTLTFGIDSALAKSADIDGSTEVSLSTTDASGITWTLTLPAGAVALPRTVTMTPMTNISSTGTLAVTSGVRLDPNGLQLLVPATLTATAGKAGQLVALLRGAHDGSGLSFAETTVEGTTLSTPIRHFSTAGTGADPDMSHICNLADSEYEAAAAAAADAATQPLVVPPPPAIDPSPCKGNDKKNAEAIDAYIDSMRAPEGAIIERLFGAAKERTMCVTVDGTPADQVQLEQNAIEADALAKAKPAVEHVYARAKKALQQYVDDPPHEIPVIYAALAAAKEFVLLGGPETDPELWDLLRTAARNARDYYLKKVTDEHALRYIRVVVSMEQQCELIGCTPTYDVVTLKKQQHVTLTLDGTATTTGSDLAGTVTFHGVMDFDYGSYSDEKWSPLTDELTVTGEFTNGGTLVSPTSFTSNLRLVDAKGPLCPPSLHADLDTLGPATETWQIGPQTKELPPFVANAFLTCFLKTASYVPFPPASKHYHFELPLADAATLSSPTFGGDGGSTQCTVNLKLEHTPQP